MYLVIIVPVQLAKYKFYIEWVSSCRRKKENT